LPQRRVGSGKPKPDDLAAVSTLRQDPTNGQWVILAPQRVRRPHEAAARIRQHLPRSDPGCPFCSGNEHRTPPEILRVPDGEEWSVRVVPNLFPVLAEGPVERPGTGPFREMPGVGSHEVVIESRAHDAVLSAMSPSDVARVIGVWLTRYRALMARPEIREVVVFKNHGPLAGTSLDHSHSQIVATPVFLPRLLRRLDVATRYFNDHETCVYDDVLTAELEAGDRIVHENPSFVAFAPFASASAVETWIVPRRHGPSFGGVRDDELTDLADSLVEIARLLFRAFEDPDWNLVVYSAPSDGHEAFHWHIKIVPRLTTLAGFEMGSAMGINTETPEHAASGVFAAQ
jgi:UDPglucose--hexose-1-phosphate uridylyltransferase